MNRDFIKRFSASTAVHLTLLAGWVLLVAALITHGTYIYGADVDWVSQHSVLPDYFRQHFYQTGELFPEFAPDLGAGQNIYYFAYHGFLSPFTLLSYCLPWVSMVDYTIVSNLIVTILSAWLFYYWMRKKDFSPRMAWFSAFLFSCAAPLIYHSHKQVMFVQYMPFLILAYMGIERLYAKKKGGLLAVSVFLMLMTSYFFSVSALFALTFFAVYKYIGTTEKLCVRTFLSAAWRYAYCLLTGIFMAGVLLLPTLYALLAGRGDEAGEGQTLSQLLIPKLSLTGVAYSAYGIGVTAVGFLAILYFLLHRKKAGSKFMAAFVLLFTCLPLFLYFLNGLLYLRTKALIPFLPLVCYMIGCFCCEVRDCRLQLKPYLIAAPILLLLAIPAFLETPVSLCLIPDLGLCLLGIRLAQKYRKSWIFFLPCCLTAMITCIAVNVSCGLLKTETAAYMHSPVKNALLENAITADSSPSVFRSGDMSAPKATNNQYFGTGFYGTGFYSSAYNRYYRDFCYNDILLANPTVNPISVTVPNDALYQRFMGVKYLVSDYGAPAGYTPIAKDGYFTLYQNPDVYSIGFGGYELMSLREYRTLSPEDKEFAVLRYIVVDRELPDVYVSPYEPVNLKPDLSALSFVPTIRGDYRVTIPASSGTRSAVIELPSSLQEDLYVVNTQILERPNTRACIRVNLIQNVLSGKNATLPNDNFHLRYMVSSAEPLNTMTIDFVAPADYVMTDLTISKVSYQTIWEQGKNLSRLTDARWKESNRLTGTISMEQDGYFATTIPYDEGFTVLVDGQETSYELTDNAFLGFPMAAGTHSVEICFHAPFRTAGICLSLLGIGMLLAMLVLQGMRKS